MLLLHLLASIAALSSQSIRRFCAPLLRDADIITEWIELRWDTENLSLQIISVPTEFSTRKSTYSFKLRHLADPDFEGVYNVDNFSSRFTIPVSMRHVPSWKDFVSETLFQHFWRSDVNRIFTDSQYWRFRTLTGVGNMIVLETDQGNSGVAPSRSALPTFKDTLHVWSPLVRFWEMGADDDSCGDAVEPYLGGNKSPNDESLSIHTIHSTRNLRCSVSALSNIGENVGLDGAMIENVSGRVIVWLKLFGKFYSMGTGNAQGTLDGWKFSEPVFPIRIDTLLIDEGSKLSLSTILNDGKVEILTEPSTSDSKCKGFEEVPVDSTVHTTEKPSLHTRTITSLVFIIFVYIFV